MSHRDSIVMLLTGLGVGGAERQAVHLACHLKRSGRDIRLVTMIDPVAFQSELSDLNIPLISLGMQRGSPTLGAFLRLVKELRQERPGVLLCFMYHANVMGRLAGWFAGVPRIIVSVRNEYFGGTGRERIIRGTNKLSEATVVNSAMAANSLIARNVIDANQLHLIPNGIEINSTAPVPIPRVQLGLPDDAFVWIAVGRLEPQKDYKNLLKAFATMDRLNDHLLIVGDGLGRLEVEATLSELSLKSRVHLLGRRTDVPALLATADALVLASAWEGLPNVIMESLLLEVPVVSTDVGGVGELVENGVSGFIVPPCDAKALAESMCRMAGQDIAHRNEMGSEGRRHICNNYALDLILELWDNLLTDHDYD
jgi:glycosyltransferase involved in cell wall biosynthesis